jgi:hypothetical protein
MCCLLFVWCLVWFGLVWFGSAWFGSVLFGSVRFGSVRFVCLLLLFIYFEDQRNSNKCKKGFQSTVYSGGCLLGIGYLDSKAGDLF